MKKLLTPVIATLALLCSAASLAAQPAPVILVVDMSKIVDTHAKTEEQKAKLQEDEKKAQEELEALNKEGNALLAEFNDLKEQAGNPALTAEAKTGLQTKLQSKAEEVQRKKVEVDSFRQNTQRSFQQRIKTFRDMILEEIGAKAAEVAKKRGATLLIDKSGPTMLGVSNVIYSDPAYDITDEVIKELAKSSGAPAAAKPATTTAKPAAATKAPAGGETPTVTFPGK